jgi:cytochrome c oxidase subunit II
MPVGPRGAAILDLWWLFFYISIAVYLLVIGFLIYSLWRSRKRAAGRGIHIDKPGERKAWIAIGAAFVLTVVTLIGLMTSEFVITRALHRPVPDPVRILVTGHQWWWEIEYDDPDPSRRVRTANEFYIPVGRPVQLILSSRDVIHSFWVPSITGKKDLIPGRTTSEILIAERDGTYMGQCAEFCGFQHAKMRLLVHAKAPDEFEAWKQRQLESAREPDTPEEQHGREVFLKSTCILCHSIQGTAAAATVAPDLTHVASRRSIAAGALPTTASDIASWIRDPQRVKPGSKMPASVLAPEDLRAVAAYLASLE